MDAIELTRELDDGPGLLLIMAAGEETGRGGSRQPRLVDRASGGQHDVESRAEFGRGGAVGLQ